jgi:inosine/xanthosine triphosphate pyrophosphatase family protein
MKIFLASNNPHKIQELRPFFASHTLALPSDAGIFDFHPEEH